LIFPFAWALLVVVQAVPWLVVDLAFAIVKRRATSRQPTSALACHRHRCCDLHRRASLSPDAGVPNAIVASPAGTPFRIAFLADIQQDLHTSADRAREVYTIVNGTRPDVVLSGGDWINTGPDYIDQSAATASELKSRLGTFSVRGDHEHFAYLDRERSVGEIEQAMRRHGISMLNNEVRWFEHRGKRIAVLLINYNYIFRSDATTIDKLIVDPAAPTTSPSPPARCDAGQWRTASI
jgi:hypothetical protein